MGFLMRHGNQVEWALHCVNTLAMLPEGRRLSAVALAERFEVPPKYLAKALQALAGRGLIASTTGPRGGYCLARPAGEIRLLDVVDAVEGGGRMFRCEEIRRRGPCKGMSGKLFAGVCPLAAAMWKAEEAWRRELAGVTIADMVGVVAKDVSPVLLNVLKGWAEEKGN